jgi:hypothetical protein
MCANRMPYPTGSGRRLGANWIRVMVQAVRSLIGPFSGQVCNKVCILDLVWRSKGCSSRAVRRFAAWISSRSAAGRSVFGPVPWWVG